MNEIWQDIEGYDGMYRVSNTGLVMSLYGKTPRILKPSVTKMHQQVLLYKRRVPVSVYVHTLVAECFIGERPQGCDIHHIDENPLNNHVDNLQYVDRYTHIHLSSNVTRLTDNEVTAMIFAYNTSRLTMKEIGRPFGADKQRVYAIVKGKAWAHLHHLVIPRNRNQEQAS